MTSAQTAAGEPRSALAIVGGIAAGLLTVAIIGGAILANGSTEADSTVAATDGRIGFVVDPAVLQAGECVDLNLEEDTQVALADCNGPHLAEITSVLQHPDAGGSYPGDDAMGDWIAGQCETEFERYTGVGLLQTTLSEGALLPDSAAWSLGNHQAACYLTSGNASSLTQSVAGLGSEYPRGDQVVVSRLIEGDCFTPTEDVESFALNSNSTVNLVSCDGGYNGIFFGRTTLEEPLGTLFPGEELVGDTTSDLCAGLFADHFDSDAAGFNYRYWRPNQESWDLDDRNVLCAILDAEPLQENFDPSLHEPFFDLAAGDCFNLAPEETSDSLRLDDQVRIVSCDEPHVGEMIGSGTIDASLEPQSPIEDGIQALAGTECEQLFEDFVGISPYQSDLGNFPFWYPNETGWNDGDRRFACAFLDNELRSVSFEGAEAAS